MWQMPGDNHFSLPTREVVMKSLKTALAVLVLFAAGDLIASGPVGIYAMVDKVVFEPNDTAPERIQIWGAFALVDGGVSRVQGALPAQRGYLYFRLPTSLESRSEATPQTIKKEWMDLKAVAGAGQAIGFGNWAYIGPFSSLQFYPQWGGSGTDLRVRQESERPASPSIYSTNAGIVKLDQGNHAAII